MKNFVALVMLCSSVVALGMNAPARAEFGAKGTSSVGPAIFVGNGDSVFGVDSKFNVSENLSLRPFISLPSGGVALGTSLTYDFETIRSYKFPITPFVGGGLAVYTGGSRSSTQAYFTGGAEFGISDTLDLRAALDVPLSSNNSSTNVRLGAGFKF